MQGIFLCLYGDFTSKDKPLPTSSHFIIACQLALDVDCIQWVHPVSDKNKLPPSFPTNRKFGASMYSKGCHSAVRTLCKAHQDPGWAESFEAGLIYLWDHDEQSRPILAPRQCLPIAVINYTSVFIIHQSHKTINAHNSCLIYTLFLAIMGLLICLLLLLRTRLFRGISLMTLTPSTNLT